VIPAVLTGVDFGTGMGLPVTPTGVPPSVDPAVVFALGITFGVTNAVNYAQLGEFYIVDSTS
jgi:hypothetical protein